MISKELLSELLNIKMAHVPQQTTSRYIEFYSKTICNHYELMEDYSTLHGYLQRINIHELEHMCKEWATNKGYQFKVYIQTDKQEEWKVGKSGMGWELYKAKNCIEACEWIMEQNR